MNANFETLRSQNAMQSGSPKRFGDVSGTRGIPFVMQLATPTPFDVNVMVSRADGISYHAPSQTNIFKDADPLSMGRSTCHRRYSTGVIFTDNDRQQDD